MLQKIYTVLLVDGGGGEGRFSRGDGRGGEVGARDKKNKLKNVCTKCLLCFMRFQIFFAVRQRRLGDSEGVNNSRKIKGGKKKKKKKRRVCKNKDRGKTVWKATETTYSSRYSEDRHVHVRGTQEGRGMR